MRTFISAILVFTLMSCEEKAPTAQMIVDNAIANTCSGLCEKAEIEFSFRGRTYRSSRDGGAYIMERITSDSLGIVTDVLTNQGFNRFVNDSLVKVVDTMATKYANSVNSVHYFAQLPFGLNAPAVQKEFLGEDEINGQSYYEIGITFQEEGGGTDYEDEFVYWIHKEKYTVDYLAYSYATDGGGIRFREAYNPRVEEGIRFVDYRNYKPKSLEVQLSQLDSLFQEGELELLSDIKTEDIVVSIRQ